MCTCSVAVCGASAQISLCLASFGLAAGSKFLSTVCPPARMISTPAHAHPLSTAHLPAKSPAACQNDKHKRTSTCRHALSCGKGGRGLSEPPEVGQNEAEAKRFSTQGFIHSGWCRNLFIQRSVVSVFPCKSQSALCMEAVGCYDMCHAHIR